MPLKMGCKNMQVHAEIVNELCASCLDLIPYPDTLKAGDYVIIEAESGEWVEGPVSADCEDTGGLIPIVDPEYGAISVHGWLGRVIEVNGRDVAN
jgi:hypothetical protein